jgi:predicted membrane metal-binding protein
MLGCTRSDAPCTSASTIASIVPGAACGAGACVNATIVTVPSAARVSASSMGHVTVGFPMPVAVKVVHSFCSVTGAIGRELNSVATPVSNGVVTLAFTASSDTPLIVHTMGLLGSVVLGTLWQPLAASADAANAKLNNLLWMITVHPPVTGSAVASR